MDHPYTNNELGSASALLSVLLWALTYFDLSEAVKAIASCLALLSGAASLFINFPKIQKRFREVFPKKKKSEP